MTVLSFDYVYALGRSVGLSKAQAVLATAIAVAESGLDPKNWGDKTLSKYGSRGLWQIFTKVHPPSEVIPGNHASTWTDALIAQLEDPKINANAMWVISGHGVNWRPWSTFKNNSHLKFMAKAQAAADRVGENWQAVLGGTVPVPSPSSSGPMSADEQVAAFKKWGLTVIEHAGWRTHNRAGHGAYGPLNGVVMHHTGSEISASAMESYVYNGDAGRALPGPLCQWTIRRDGTIVMIGNGRSNHAGQGSSTTLNHVVREDYGDVTLKPGADNTDGNAHFMGFETQYDGSHAPVAAQYNAMVRGAAAVCEHFGWSAKHVIGHKEWTSRKDDPGHVDMAVFRKDVQKLLDGVEPNPVPTPEPGATYVVTLGRNVKPGSTDPTTIDLQRALIAAGFATFAKPNTTGLYGKGTEASVRKFFDKYPQFQSSKTDTAIGSKGWAFLRDLALKAGKNA